MPEKYGDMKTQPYHEDLPSLDRLKAAASALYADLVTDEVCRLQNAAILRDAADKLRAAGHQPLALAVDAVADDILSVSHLTHSGSDEPLEAD